MRGAGKALRWTAQLLITPNTSTAVLSTLSYTFEPMAAALPITPLSPPIAYRYRLVEVGRPATSESARRAVFMSVASDHGARLSDEFVTDSAEYSKNAPSWLVKRTRQTLPEDAAMGVAALGSNCTCASVAVGVPCTVPATLTRVPLPSLQSSSTVSTSKPLPWTVTVVAALSTSDAGMTLVTSGGIAVTVRPLANTSTLPSGFTAIRS